MFNEGLGPDPMMRWLNLSNQKGTEDTMKNREENSVIDQGYHVGDVWDCRR